MPFRKLRGGELAIDESIEVPIEGQRPDGAKDRRVCNVVQPAVFIVLKAFAMDGREKALDAYDIHFVLQNYPGGETQLNEDFRRLSKHKVVRDALEILAQKFATMDHVGPVEAASFRKLEGGEEGELVWRDAYERVAALLDAVRE